MATSSGSISSLGIGSGIDASAIVSQLMSIERLPLNRLKNQAIDFNAQLSNFGKLQSNISTLRDKANALNSPTLWTGTAATVSDSTALSVSTGAETPTGSYSILVNKLASSQTLTSGVFASRDSLLNEGSLTIDLGSYNNNGVFTGKAGADPITVTIDASNTSLAQIRDRINAAGSSVVAGIVNDANGARLTLRSRETGVESAFRITAVETNDDGDPATGLSALNYDAGNVNAPMQRTAVAGNAELKINGIDISSATNVLDNVVEGLNITVNKASANPVQVDVATDKAAIKTAITGLVDAFNTAANFIRTQTAYNAESKTAGALQADPGTLSLQSQLRAVINEASTASGTFGRLSDIGIALKSDGSFEVNDKKLENGLGNLTETRKLLTNDGSTNANSGFVRRFKRLSDAALGVEGLFDARTTSLRSRLDRNGKSQSDQENRLSSVEARLRRQYTALDTTMARLNAQSSYMSQQINQMFK